MTKINKRIRLYKGKLEIKHQEKSFLSEGCIYLEWIPEIRIIAVFKAVEIVDFIRVESIEICLSKIGVTTTAIPISHSIDEMEYVFSTIEWPDTNQLSYVDFHLINFPKYFGESLQKSTKIGTRMWTGRWELDTEEWLITIDQLPYDSDVYEELKAGSNYFITHVGRLRRKNGKSFKSEKAKQILETLGWFLSFSLGTHAHAFLPVGFDHQKKKIWSQWIPYRQRPYKSTRMCVFPRQGLEKWGNAWNGFFMLSRQERWNAALPLIVAMFLDSTEASNIDMGIILAQVVYEFLSMHYLDDAKIISDKGLDNLTASDRLRLLLSLLGIRRDIPLELIDLTAAAKPSKGFAGWSDGPQAITELRNQMVHLNPKKLKETLDRNHRIRYDAYRLSLWYIEAILLRLMNYDHSYRNRLKIGWYDEYEKVPWAK